MIRFSLPFIPTGLCFFILNSGDAFFLVQYHGAAVFGIYAIAYKISNAVVMLATQPLIQVWNTWMYDAYKQTDRSEVFGRAATRVLSSLALGGTLLFMFKEELFTIIGQGKYLPAAAFVAPLIFAQFFLRLGNFCDSAFYVTQKTSYKPYIAAASTVVMLAAYWLLIEPFAGMGAAIATLVGFLFHFMVSLLVSRRVFRIQFEWDRLLGLLGISTLLCFLSVLVGDGMDALPWKILLALAWPACIWATGLLSPAERQYIGKVVRQVRSFGSHAFALRR
jgi:O-antigen/teichoic acid export membrane protein